MGRPRLNDRHLPIRMRRRGKRYYYRARGGQETPLGPDLAQARVKWAELENLPLSADSRFAAIADKFERDVIPTKATRTRKDYKRHLAVLRMVFDEMPMAAIAPHHVRRYLNLRMKASLVQSNRERAVLSLLFNWARGEGIVNIPNPCVGIHGKKEAAREVYVDDAAYAAVWAVAGAPVRDAMDLARLTGQRPADVLRMARTDVRDGCLEVRQAKTGKRLRIEVTGELAGVISRILARSTEAGAERKVSSVYLVQDDKGQPITYWRFVKMFAAARAAAGQAWQFRDLRAKAGTEKTDELGPREAQRLLGHASMTTTETYIRNRRGDRVKPLK
ncbi:MAG: tyrosine-type recombinase/integrase [Phycisphaerales bacterium]|nr:tyrosine-type recombinase/integrase [Phycisphaerales bacterium]